jgi:hypothetical protein
MIGLAPHRCQESHVAPLPRQRDSLKLDCTAFCLVGNGWTVPVSARPLPTLFKHLLIIHQRPVWQHMYQPPQEVLVLLLARQLTQFRWACNRANE